MAIRVHPRLWFVKVKWFLTHKKELILYTSIWNTFARRFTLWWFGRFKAQRGQISTVNKDSSANVEKYSTLKLSFLDWFSVLCKNIWKDNLLWNKYSIYCIIIGYLLKLYSNNHLDFQECDFSLSTIIIVK